jgi:peptidoglycan/LPS O-acetylase OafA/YrhL
MNDSELIKDQLTYNPQIDGLRAIAVLAVVFFHFDMLHVTGGFVGVDVFFVISGFLISSIIMNEIEKQDFSIAAFYERRARRILPALCAMMAVTMIGGWLFLLPAAFKDFGASVVSTCLCGANLFFWKTENYFGLAADEKPLLHMWSLGVEEQFYFALPFVLTIMCGNSRTQFRANYRALVVTLVVVWVATLLLSQCGLYLGKLNATFYLLPTRFWELLTGTLIALIPIRRLPRNSITVQLVILLGLCGIVIPCFLYDATTSFPGFYALPPCLGAGLIIAVTANRSHNAPTLVSSVLGSRPLVFCGLISYSLYLWHWPVVVFMEYVSLEPPTLWLRSCGVAVCFLLAVLSWWLVERPFRRRSVQFGRPIVFAAAGLSMIVFAGVGLLIYLGNGMPNRFPVEMHPFFESPDSPPQSQYNLNVDDVREDRLHRFGSNKASEATVLLWGDSHAMCAFPAIEKICYASSVAAYAATHTATAPVVDWPQHHVHGLGNRAPQFAEEIMSFVQRKDIRHVILIAHWMNYDSPEFSEKLIVTIRRLRAVGARVWFVIDVPQQRYNAPKALVHAALFSKSEMEYCTTERAGDLYGTRDERSSFVARLIEAGAVCIDPRPEFWDTANRVYRMSRNGKALYFDSHHISEYAAVELIAPVLIRDMEEVWTIRAPKVGGEH